MTTNQHYQPIYVWAVTFFLLVAPPCFSSTTTYDVYRNTTNDPNTATLVATDVEGTSYHDQDPSLVGNQIYYYWLRTRTTQVYILPGQPIGWTILIDPAWASITVTMPESVLIGEPFRYDYKLTVNSIQADFDHSILYFIDNDGMIGSDWMWHQDIPVDIVAPAFVDNQPGSGTAIFDESDDSDGVVELALKVEFYNDGEYEGGIGGSDFEVGEVTVLDDWDPAPNGLWVIQPGENPTAQISWNPATGNSDFSSPVSIYLTQPCSPGNFLSALPDSIDYGETPDDDHCPELGETCRVHFPLCANGYLWRVEASLGATPAAAVSIADNESEYYIPENGCDSGGSYEITILHSDTPVTFYLDCEYTQNGTDYCERVTFPPRSFPEECDLGNISVFDHEYTIDPTEDCHNDGVFDSGDELRIRVALQNDGAYPLYDVEVAVEPEPVPGLFEGTYDLNYEQVGDIAPGQCVWLTAGRSLCLRAERSLSGTYPVDLYVIHDGVTEDSPIILPNALSVTVEPQSWINVYDETTDFGFTTVGIPVYIASNIRNEGGGDLEILDTSITAPAGVQVTVDPPLPWPAIPPGQTMDVTATILPETFVGRLDPPIEIVFVSDACTDTDDQEDRMRIWGLVSKSGPVFDLETSDKVSSEDPDVSGDTIVWQEGGDGNGDVFSYDILSGVTTRLTNHVSDQVAPMISGDLVVWCDNRNQDGTNRNWDIYGYDLSIREEFLISSDPSDEWLLGVDSDYVAFSRKYDGIDYNNDGVDDDHLRNIYLFHYDGEGRGTINQVTQFVEGTAYEDRHTLLYESADFGGGALGWKQAVYSWEADGQFWYRDSSSTWHKKIEETASRIGNYEISREYSAVDDGKFVYIDRDTTGASNDDRVFLWEAGNSTQITNAPEEADQDHEAPAIGDDYVVFWSDGDQGQDYLNAHQLSTGREFAITDLDQSTYRLDGNLLVMGGDDGTIRYTYLPYGEIPTLSISTPLFDQQYANSEIFQTFTGTASDSDGSIVEVKYRVNGGLWGNATGTTDWTFDVSLAPGENRVEICARDNSNNYSPLRSRTITRNVLPDLSVTTPADSQTVTHDVAALDFVGSATDPERQLSAVCYRNNLGPWYTATGTESWSFIVSLENGNNVVEIRALDAAGEYSAVETVNIQRNRLPVLSVLSPQSGETFPYETASASFVGQATDFDGSVGGIRYRVRRQAWQQADGTSIWNFTINLATGENLVEVQAIDDLDEYSYSEICMLIRESPPTPTNTFTPTGTFTNTPIVPTNTPTTPAPTNTPLVPTDTPLPTDTNTLTPVPPISTNTPTTTSVLPTPAPSQPRAVRHFSQPCRHVASGSITVSIWIDLAGREIQSMALYDTPPAGWRVSDISQGGSWDEDRQKVKWGPIFSNFDRTFTYKSIPSGAVENSCFRGEFSVDGTSNLIIGEQCLGNCGCHPADIGCEGCIEINDLTGYGTDWKYGQHNHINVVTNAGYIWHHGECYHWQQDSQTWRPSSAPQKGYSIGGSATASRTLVDALVPGSVVSIVIELSPSQEQVPSTIAIEEILPVGWVPSNISDEGEWLRTQHKINWGPFFEGFDRVLSYDVEVPSAAVGEVCWSGQVSVDGNSQAIGGVGCDVVITPTATPTYIDTPPPTAKPTATFNPVNLDTNRNGTIDAEDLLRLLELWHHQFED